MAFSSRLLDNYFKITERGSTVGAEVRGGLVTFVAMAYIVVLNPLILGSFSPDDAAAKTDVLGNILPVSQVAAVTALVAGFMSILFGIVANYPFGIAAGLGINTLLAVTIAPQVTWPEAMGLVVIDGIIIVLLAVTGFRTAVFNAIPSELKAAIAAGIGAFIAFIGLVDSGFVRRIPDAAGTTVPVGLGIDGSIASWPTAVFVFGVLLMGILVVRKVRGGLLIGIVVTTGVAAVIEALTDVGPSQGVDPKGWNLSVPILPDTLFQIPDLSLVGDVDLFGAFTRIGVLAASLLVFTLVLANFFDAMGTMTGLGKEGNLVDDKGNLPGIGKALVVEGTGAIAGGAASASSNTVFVESASGIAEGARTGLANVVTGVLFLAAMFLTPLTAIVPIEAAAPALVVVGALMIGQVRDIDFTKFEVALPAFLTIVVMPFTFSIANGIGVGFITWVILAVAARKAKSVHPLLWVVAALFVAYFVVGPITDAVT
ncbi:NCS2 family permease [Rhodococcus sp. BP-252]|uniref:NCS2 family permease n=1 Tax=unclassified Rhodococcus (in: high G+C Gram-positive bacteria) TaxID=192944 RepID=UPI001C9A6570|nr:MULTISPECIES: NCS2 family permease [unclassified Rhodococcus (in: high G+C Gram-positive bacteria)]MBY6412680.1 NCS2 family permease [Rhodococcus sp. BP-320]MBY6417522.1 NCS2 family permease [Rhodococcus sp. BP-321]MBY6421700.1 NCS2 family permease [Rhodococcus sp. BP-324]MBY6427439.1 NCS2 family permease [Rhodococcus sp. BP-323]MBY6432710.1 NCS2 family permease [Rhodococcus sp. BP-322]